HHHDLPSLPTRRSSDLPARRGTASMKLTTVTNISVDGVTQGHRRIDAETRREAGGPDEDGSGGFERFGWAPPLLDDEASTFISQDRKSTRLNSSHEWIS